MKFKKFNEYLNEKGHLVEKPKNKEKSKHKAGRPHAKHKDALGNCGDDKLVYKPKTDTPLQAPADQPWKKKASVKEWLEKTRGTSNTDFINDINKKHNIKVDYSRIKTNQDLIEATTYLLKQNNSFVENLVLSLKRANLLNFLNNEIKHLTEGVSPPIGDEDENNEAPEDMGDEDMEDNDMEDEDEGEDMEDNDMDNDMEYEGDEDNDMEDEGDEDMEDEGDEDMEDEDEGDEDTEEDMEEEDMEDEDMEDEDEGDEDMEGNDVEDNDMEDEDEEDEDEDFLGNYS